jgi:predicted enzyme related to lactoylglutathione lyase
MRPLKALCISTAAVLTLLSCAGTRAAPNGEEAGQFTGQIKPVLYVADVQRSAPFFRDVLGFGFLGYTNLDGEPYYAEMTAGGSKFGLHNPQTEEQRSWVGHQRLYFRVRDVGEQRSRVERRGGKPGEIIETAWMDMFIVRDLDGHQIVFAETDPTRHAVDPW